MQLSGAELDKRPVLVGMLEKEGSRPESSEMSERE